MRTKERNKILIFYIGLMFIVGLMSCKKESRHNGFVLQNFKIINSQLYSIVKGIKDSAYISTKANDIIILELRIHDSVPEFCLTSAKKNKLNEFYIYSSNSRIVGYVEDKSIQTEVIVLSDIDNKVDFEMTFYKFLVPTSDTKYFEYIYFPDNQYSVDARGFGAPPPLFDPYFYYYTYKGNKIIPSTYGKY
jgi:hypothetical protein